MILTEQNYHSPEANLMYMGASQFKSFQKCPSMALAEIHSVYARDDTTALLVGSYADAHFSRTLDIFRAQHPDIFKRDGGLKSDYIQAEEIISRIERDHVLMAYIGQGQKQTILTGEIAGVPFKAKPDFLHSDRIVDLKIMRDFAPVWVDGEGKLPFVEAWGYDIQGAIYQEIVRQNTGKKLPFIIAGATKEKVPDIGLFNIPQHRLDYCLDLVEHLAPEYDEIKRGHVAADNCGKCDYCKQTKVLFGPVDYDAIAV